MLVSAVASILPFALELLLVTTQSPSAVALRFLYISLARKLGIKQQLLPPPFSPLPRLLRSVIQFPQSRVCPCRRHSPRLPSHCRRSVLPHRRPLVVPFIVRDPPLPLVVGSRCRMRFHLAKSRLSLRQRRPCSSSHSDLPFQQGIFQSPLRSAVFRYLSISHPPTIFYCQVRRLVFTNRSRLVPWLLRLLGRNTRD